MKQFLPFSKRIFACIIWLLSVPPIPAGRDTKKIFNRGNLCHTKGSDMQETVKDCGKAALLQAIDAVAQTISLVETQ